MTSCLAILSVEAWSASEWLLVGGGVLLLLLLAYVSRYWLLVRFPLWLLNHTIYRLRVHGAESIPATGPALLVANHVSYLDWAMILASQKRRIRFIVWSPFLRIPLLRIPLRLARVIPVDGGKGPRAIIEALRLASDALARGEVVCIFAEGGISRTGFMLPFQRGLELILKRSPVPVVPVCLDHVWGSIFSYQRGRFFWKLPKQIPYPIYVNFGKPLPATTTAFEVRQAIQKLSADSAVRRAGNRVPVHRQFIKQAVRHPFRPCIIDPNSPGKKSLKYGEALAGAKVLAARLALRLGDDRMVGLWLPPSMGGALTNIAIAFLAKTAVNLNYSASMPIVQSAIQQCGIRRVLTSKLFTVKVPIDPGPGVELVYLDDFRKEITTFQRLRAYIGVLLLPRFIQEWLTLYRPQPTMDDVVTIIFSSGSTGEPKGVMLTHANLAANVESTVQAIDPVPSDRLVGILPFFHSFGYTIILWLPLQIGASTIYYPNPLQPKEIGELCRTHRGTIFLSTATFLRSYLKRCAPGDFASLRLLVCGAEKLPQPLADEFHKKFGIRPLEGYGCTELSPVVSANVPDFRQGSVCQIGNRPGSIGQPIPGVAAKIIHRETGEPLPPGQEGLLLIYGANVMKGYLGRDDLTRKKIIDGWYITGDLAKLDEDGFITITGREERFAKVGGEMVPLEKVEEELHAVLNTNERICVVTAIPDERKGERIVVLHLPLNGVSVQQVWERLSDRGLPNIYVPGPRDFFGVDDLPILGSGKLDLKKCKEKAAELAART